MNSLEQSAVPDVAVDELLTELKQAEAKLLAAVHPENHPRNVRLLEAHAVLWEAISALQRPASNPGTATFALTVERRFVSK
jgi:tRNA A37 N6-isopentenylltransferase MiaA